MTDVSALAGCPGLHTLYMSGCKGVTDVSALAGCAALRMLNVTECGNLELDVSAMSCKIVFGPKR